jgi:MFS family permease
VYFLVQTTIGKKMLLDCCALTSARAAGVLFAMTLCAIAGMTAAGPLSRLVGNRRRPFVIVGTGLSLPALAAMALGAAWAVPALVTGGMLLLGLSCFCGPVYSSAMKELNPPGAVGTAVGFSNTVCFLVVAAAGQGAGLLLDAFSGRAVRSGGMLFYPPRVWALLSVVCLGLLAAAWLIAWWLPETRGRNDFRRSS